MNLIYNSKNIIFLSCIYIFLIIFTFNVNILAGELEASQYQIILNIDKPEVIVSENIIIKTKVLDNESENLKENIYLERFKLIKLGGEEINPEYIEVETPFVKSNLADQHRFLIMKKDQSESWFKISILSEAAFASPGEYKADMFIEGLDWEISLKLIIKPFAVLNINENRFLITINKPSNSNFHISPELYKLNIDSNHIDWKIEAFIEYGGLYDEKDHFLSSENIFYYFENTNYKNDFHMLSQEKFNRFSEKETITLISGEQYKRGLDSIRLAIFLGEKWSCQAAGVYSGTIIFTVERR
jgi:hypothetical protein